MHSHHYKGCIVRVVLFFAGIFCAAQIEAQVSPTAATLFPNPEPCSVPAGTVVVQGVEARPFDAALWQHGAINLVPALQSPFLTPLGGNYRNIYAPSVVQVSNHWRIFYGGWDGIPSGNDHVYSVMTDDFQNFYSREVLITPGSYQHVCNVNAVMLPDSTLRALCTVYPDPQGWNFIADFKGLNQQVSASAKNQIGLAGYANKTPDFNGMNALLFDHGQYTLYFGDFRNDTHIYRATSADGTNYTYQGSALASTHNVNDVKKFRTTSGFCYLMALHQNISQTWYSMSFDGTNFGPELPLIKSLSSAEQYIVSLGWIVKGAQDKPGRRLLGLIYGAGSNPQLDANRIFVRWLQIKLVFVSDDGTRFPGTLAVNANKQVIPLTGAKNFSGVVEVYAEDGQTLLCTTDHVDLTPGMAYQLRLFNLPQMFSAN